MSQLKQTPEPGALLMAYQGDIMEFALAQAGSGKGTAWLRTNIGNAHARRCEIIGHVERNAPINARDWHDVPMKDNPDGGFSLRLPVLETGRFEAKAFFLPEGSSEPVWPRGGNVILKVEPAEYCCSNTIYTAFVRQFGANRYRRKKIEETDTAVDYLDSAGYTVIPRSGTFRDLIRELDFITGKLGFRIIQLLPIHPTPTTYARMGRFGSPFAALDFMDVDPALAEFDRHTTPLEQFLELVDAVHERDAKIFLDIPVNHTGWASWLQIHHPDWFKRLGDKTFKSPEAWGVVWEDLAGLNYDQAGLWKYMSDVFLYWCRHGVNGFRCDAGYMVPSPVWEYITARVREEFPDTIFLLEGLGGRPEVVEHLLSNANLDWAYSELFQNYDRGQIDAYLPGCTRVSSTKGVLVHFAETHDNNRLAARSEAYARMRTALAALCSDSGAFGITNGVEWFADEKINVHGVQSLNWNSKINQVDHISTLNAILEAHPAFHAGSTIRLIHKSRVNGIALLRENQAAKSAALVLANLNDDRQIQVSWHENDFAAPGATAHDLITGRSVPVVCDNGVVSCSLAPAEILCLVRDSAETRATRSIRRRDPSVPDRIGFQRLRAKALEMHCACHGYGDVSEADADRLAKKLGEDPDAFCLDCTGDANYQPVTRWEWPRDVNRTVMVPPGHFILVKAPHKFVVELGDSSGVARHESSIRTDGGKHFCLVSPITVPDTHRELAIVMTVYEHANTQRSQSAVLLLSKPQATAAKLSFDRQEVQDGDCYALCTNGRGAMVQVHGVWGRIGSQYDALLAGNLDPNCPVDRRVMFTRCRGWLVYRGYSQEINHDCLRNFAVDRNGNVTWHFVVPSGLGKVVPLDVRLRMPEGRNTVMLEFHRLPGKSVADALDDSCTVKIILRPDVEDRNNHEKTKAFAGPEKTWPESVVPQPNGFMFGASPDHRLRMIAQPGTFTHESEWTYMLHHPLEAERGLDVNSDLFSPGYFSLMLEGGHKSVLQADIVTPAAGYPPAPPEVATGPADHQSIPLAEAMRRAIRSYVVKRDDSLSVIAGYPWFLDWGRDTLICLRGIVAAGMLKEAREILRQFARWESRGTLPNMIRGADASNRDTSDAPLWFFVACNDYLHAAGKKSDFLADDCGGRTVREVLCSIALSYVEGTSNGIVMDKESGLIFSPAHFTWMDTNHPAGSPREGYPVEIQALWHSALNLMADIEPKGPWRELADRVRSSINALYRKNADGYLSDCLHGTSGKPAREATPDDALRPNQLLTITLGAVRDPGLCASILRSCEELLIPGAIRTLADRPVKHALPVRHNGIPLNDPHHPYWGTYGGNEDTRRKPAYHNGTAWTWIFPSYCEAMFMTYGARSRETALSMLSSSSEVINRGCIGQVPEILDGNSPHNQRGCGAQAWGVTELYRVLALLSRVP